MKPDDGILALARYAVEMGGVAGIRGCVVKVDTGTADVGSSVILLDGGVLPAVERSEVAKIGVAVIVSVPERVRGASSPRALREKRERECETALQARSSYVLQS